MEWLINWLWQGLALAAIAWLALACLPRVNGATRHRVWWLTLCLVLLLPAVSAWPSQGAANASLPIDPVRDDTSGAIVLDGTPAWVPAAAWTIWLAWCLTSLLRAARSFIALRRGRRATVPLDDEFESRLPLWRSRGREGRRARLCLSNDVPAAGVFGFRDPIIALSPRMLSTLSYADLDRVLVHEYAHVRRRDDLGRLVLVLIHAVFGLHPAVWWVGRAIDLEREIACDDWVLARTGDGRRYARCLTTLAAAVPAGAECSSLTPGVSLAARRLTRRVTRLLEGRHTAATRVSPAVIGIWLPALLSVTIGLSAVRLVVIDEAKVLAASATSVVDRELEAIAPSLPGTTPPPASAPSRRDGLMSQSTRKFATARTQPAGVTAPPVAEPRMPDQVLAKAAPALPNLRRASTVASLGAIAPPAGSTPTSGNPTAPRNAADARPPWTIAADAGVAIGSGSKHAAVKTANFFSRLGKSVAGSF